MSRSIMNLLHISEHFIFAFSKSLEFPTGLLCSYTHFKSIPQNQHRKYKADSGSISVNSHFNLHIPLKPYYFLISSFQDICLFSPSCCYHFPEFSVETNNWMALMSHFRPADWVMQSDFLCSLLHFETEFPEGYLPFIRLPSAWSFYSQTGQERAPLHW